MRDTYAYAIQTAKGKFHGNAEERDGKLHFKGHGRDRGREERDLDRDQDHPDLAERHRRRHPGDRRTGARPRRRRGAGSKTYTVKAGDTLSKIAKEHLGSAGAYMKIFELNKDQLTDPDKIKPGQVLRLP